MGAHERSMLDPRNGTLRDQLPLMVRPQTSGIEILVGAKLSRSPAVLGNPRSVNSNMNDFTNEERAAAEAAASILQTDPSVGPVDVVHVDPKQDVYDERYLILLFQGERGFLFDRVAGRTSIFDLAVDPALEGDARLKAKIKSARLEAAKLKLGKVYVVKSANDKAPKIL